MWHIYDNPNVFDSDAYGVDTDNPETAYERIDNALKVKDERAISVSFNEWLEDTAREYFCDVGSWNDDVKEAWRDKVFELI